MLASITHITLLSLWAVLKPNMFSKFLTYEIILVQDGKKLLVKTEATGGKQESPWGRVPQWFGGPVGASWAPGRAWVMTV